MKPGMKTSREGVKLIISFEGKHRKIDGGRYQAYQCPAKVWTIHAGVTEGVHEGMVVTDAEGEAMFRAALAKFENAVIDLVKVDINQNQFDALVSFAYNCGSGALAKSGLLKKVNAGDFAGAKREFGKWTRGGGKVLPGLVRRREEEAALFARPVESEPLGSMPQAVDEPKSDAVVAASTLYESRSLWATLVGFVMWFCGVVKDYLAQGWDWACWLFGILPDVTAKTKDTVGQIGEIAGLIGANIQGIATVIAVACVVVVIVRHAALRLEAKT